MKKTIATILTTIIITFSLTIGIVFCYEKLSWNTYDVKVTEKEQSIIPHPEYIIWESDNIRTKEDYGDGDSLNTIISYGNGDIWEITLYWDLK